MSPQKPEVQTDGFLAAIRLTFLKFSWSLSDIMFAEALHYRLQVGSKIGGFLWARDDDEHFLETLFPFFLVGKGCIAEENETGTVNSFVKWLTKVPSKLEVGLRA